MSVNTAADRHMKEAKEKIDELIAALRYTIAEDSFESYKKSYQNSIITALQSLRDMKDTL